MYVYKKIFLQKLTYTPIVIICTNQQLTMNYWTGQWFEYVYEEIMGGFLDSFVRVDDISIRISFQPWDGPIWRPKKRAKHFFPIRNDVSALNQRLTVEDGLRIFAEKIGRERERERKREREREKERDRER